MSCTPDVPNTNQHKNTFNMCVHHHSIRPFSTVRQDISMKPLHHPCSYESQVSSGKKRCIYTEGISVSSCWVTFTWCASIMECGACTSPLWHLFKGDMCGVVSLIHHCQKKPIFPLWLLFFIPSGVDQATTSWGLNFGFEDCYDFIIFTALLFCDASRQTVL